MGDRTVHRVTISLGHASLRLPDRPDRFLVKGRGYKMDLLSHVPFDMNQCVHFARAVNPHLEVFQVSASTGEVLTRVILPSAVLTFLSEASTSTL